MDGFLIYLLLSQGLFAKVYSIVDADIELMECVIQTADGGFAILGTTWTTGPDSGDIAVIKTNPSGELVWAKTYAIPAPRPGAETAGGIIQTPDGNYVIAGYKRDAGEVNKDVLIFKINASGDLIWAKIMDRSTTDKAYSVALAGDSGFVVVGESSSSGTSIDILIMKVDKNGNLSWARTFGGTSYESASHVIKTSEGGFAVTGWTNSYNAPPPNFIILKITSTGSLSWARVIARDSVEWNCYVAQAADLGYVLVGRSGGDTTGDFFAVKLTSSGSFSWAKVVGGSGVDYANSVCRASDGGFVVAGLTCTYGPNPSTGNFYIFKLSPEGDQLWIRHFGGNNTDYAKSIIMTSDYGFAVAGISSSFGKRGFALIRLNSSGDYYGCVSPSPSAMHSPSPSVVVPSASLVSISPSLNTVGFSATSRTITVVDACPPGIEERDVYTKPGITCSPIPVGVLFLSPYDATIKIYSADGRLAHSGELRKGENRIVLETGVYLWIAGTGSCEHKGKVVIR